MTNAAITLMFFSDDEIVLMLNSYRYTYILLIQQKFVFRYDDSYTVYM